MSELKKHKRKYNIILLILSLFVMWAVIYLLILPADTMTEPAVCGLTEHIHSAECYALHTGNNESILICQYEGGNIAHQHDDFCYADGQLICSLEEIDHVHDADCYDEAHVLSCGTAVHQHNENCFAVLSGGETAMILTCGTAVHHHAASCYEIDRRPLMTAEKETNPAPVFCPEDHVPDAPPSVLPDNDTVPMMAVPEGAYVLEYDTTISKITISYESGSNWIEITDQDQNLPANIGYQFVFWYHNISVQDLIKAGGQMVYKGLPEWFQPVGKGPMLYGDARIGTIETEGDTILITFDDNWLQEHSSEIIGGSFNVKGSIDWHKLPGDGEIGKIPGLNIDFQFESGLSQKYGNIEIEKSEPELFHGDNGNYYLRYTITVRSLEDTDIPDVRVRDTFTNTGYINGYIGITDGFAEPEQFRPVEDSRLEGAEEGGQRDFVKGKLRMDNSDMIWEIDMLEGKETRTLTYYAEIAGSYVENLLSNPIQNRAYVYSGENFDFQKDDDASTFRPQSEVKIQKEMIQSSIDESGNGTLKYTILVTAAKDNSFTLENLELKDAMIGIPPAYLHGDASGKIEVFVDGLEQEVSFEDFVLTLPRLAPGETIEITYEIYATNLFLLGSDGIDITNSATITKGGRTLATAVDKETISQNTWMRKIYGAITANEQHIQFKQGEEVYTCQNSTVEKEPDPPDGFTVPAGSHKYEIVLNENGIWDLSSTNMEDAFGSEFLKYKGYVQIQLFEDYKASSDQLTDTQLLCELEGEVPAKTIWLNVDGKGEFSFQPKQLGIDQKAYTYLLTYYASPNNTENVGTVDMVNSFTLRGDVGYGDGWLTLPGITVSARHVIQGGLNYHAGKTSWYYEPYPVYLTEAMRSGAYGKDGDDGYATQYTNGAVYWIIRMEGSIGTGTCAESGCKNNTNLGGFYIHDEPKGTKFNRDAIVGIYVASKDFDFTAYSSFADFEKKNPGMKKLTGNPQNDKWFAGTKVDHPDYMWFADNTDLNGIVFQNGYDLGDDEAMYIVLRTTPNEAVPTNAGSSETYYNYLSVVTEGVDIPAADASYTYMVTTSLMKESKGAYIYDQKTGTFTNCSNNNGNGWVISSKVNKDWLPSSGTYAAWLLNVNYYSTMSGEAYVSDFLPEGMELVYCDINNYGTSIRGDASNWPSTAYIDELHGDPDWEEQILMITVVDVKTPVVEQAFIYYYNPTTREIRWHFTGLRSGRPKTDHNEVNLRIICQVKDPELMLNGTGKTYDNYAAVWDGKDYVDMEKASVKITRTIDKGLDQEALEELGETLNGNSISGSLNQIPFTITVNPMGEDMCDGDVLPALIDELGVGLLFIEDSLTIKDANGVAYSDFSHTIEEKDQKQLLIIKNLPDNTPLTISYCIRVSTTPGKQTSISNIAYWAGYAPPASSQVKDLVFQYTPSGDVFAAGSPGVVITKVDADLHSKLLGNASFALYAVNSDGSLNDEPLRTGTTDSFGRLEFNNSDTSQEALKYNTVYCLKEETAPSGYQLDPTANCYYFMIIHPGTTVTIPDIADLDVWYDSPEYCCTIENKKQTLSIQKLFLKEDNTAYIPDSGCYRFGLYDSSGRLVEILKIEFVKGKAFYYLDDVEKEKPEFSGFDPSDIYYVYELDDQGMPIQHGKRGNMNGMTFKVTYGEDGSNELDIANSQLTITNQEDPVLLPGAGGIGKKRYYAAGGMLIILVLALSAGQVVWLTKREKRQNVR